MAVPPDHPATILIVEDDPDTAAYLALHLRRSGYRLAGVAHNGLEALRLAQTTRPDAIIMDIVLPGEIDGIEAANRILAEREVPILYLTANANPKLFERARATDPSAYLLKPFNRSPELMIGKIIWEEFPEGVGQPFYYAYQRVMRERLALQIEDHYAPWDRWFENRIFPSEDGISIYFQEITERKRAERQLALTNQRLQALSASLLTVQEQERRALARELHDELGQSLTALKITLQSLGLRPETAALKTQIDTALSIADAALQQARQMSLDLRPPQLDDLGLAAAIRWNITRQAALARLHTHFALQELPEPLPEPLAIACYRISQEAMTNVLRHAHAKNAWVGLQREGGELRFELQDDGAGFDPVPFLAGASSMGLLGMQERALLAGGRLEIDSSPGQGCRVRAIFPLAAGAMP